MAKIKSIPLNWKFALLSFVVIAFVAVVAGGGALLLRGERTIRVDDEKVLLAANLAVSDGDVQIKKSGEDRWMEGMQGDTLNEGDALRTEDESRAVLILDNGDAVRLNADSEVVLASLAPEAVIIDQVSGESYSRVASSEENTYTVRGQGVSAQALGTAYTFTTDTEKKSVEVSVLESVVKVQFDTEEKELPELKKAVINTEEKKVEVKNMNQEEYENEFVTWNKEQDKELGYEYHEKVGPVVKITEPEDGSTTEKSSVSLKGSVTDESGLKKIKVNGKIYTSKDKDGKGFDPENGTFDITVSLNDGENTINVVAYDIYWNESEVQSVKVTREVETPVPVQPTSSFYISNISSPKAGKIYVKWYVNGISTPHGFKVVWSKGANPVYPGNDYKYFSSSNTREATIYVGDGGTYYVRVCVYNGSGQCLQYTANKTVTVGEVQGAVSGLTLSSTGGAHVKWTVNGYSAQGFKVVWSKNAGPTYPTRSGDKYHYYSDPDRRTDTLTAFDGSGQYYVRVCEYLGGKCGVYSNQITVDL